MVAESDSEASGADHAADLHDDDRDPEDDIDNRLQQNHHHDRTRTVDHHADATP